MALSVGFRILVSQLRSCYPSYGAPTVTPVGLSPTERASLRWTHNVRFSKRCQTAMGRVEMWRGSSRLGVFVAPPFVWRCPSNPAITPVPHPAHRTGRADFPHPALGQEFTPSPTTGLARSDSEDRSNRKGAGVD